jgi:hypothetical protein
MVRCTGMLKLFMHDVLSNQFPIDMTDLQVVAVNLRASLRLFVSSFSLFDRFINHKSNPKTVPGKTMKCSFVNRKIGLLKPERLASGIFGHLVFSFF